MNLLSDTENARANEFASKHYVKRCRHPWLRWRRNNRAAVGIRAVQTGIGFGVTATCPYCGEQENITDHSNW